MSNRPVRPRTDFIVIHCAATKASWDGGAADIDGWHRKQGWDGIGYHFVIRRDGRVEVGEDLKKVGAHVQGYNSASVGVCMVGGLSADGKSGENNFTDAQWASLKSLVTTLKHTYPEARVLGHRDMSPDKNGDGVIKRDEWVKDCPSFSVTDWLAGDMAPLRAVASVNTAPVPAAKLKGR